MTDKIYTIDEIREIIERIMPEYEVGNVYLFGSYARNEATKDSDIDLYIEKLIYKRFHSLATLYADLEEELCKEIDIITDDSLSDAKDKIEASYLSENIMRDRVLLYGSKI